MKSIFSVLAVIACSALGAQEKKPEYEPPKYQSLFEQTETGSDARGPGAGVDKFSDGADRLTVIRAICMSLYPSTEVRGDKVQSATVVCTNIEELRAAAGLLTKLVERDASEAWIISVIPEHIEPSVGLARFQKRRPKLKMHLSATERKVLVYGSEAEVRRVTENRNRSSEFQGQFKLKQIAPKDAGVFVRAMFPSAHADPKPNNVLAVSCEAEHANGVAALVAKLDGQNPTAPKKEQVEKQFDLKHVLAADLATTIQEAFATSKTRVVEERKLWVTADLDDKLAVEALVAAVDRPVASQDNEATFRVSQIDDTILLLGELYPSIEYGKLDGGPDNLSVRGDKATLQRISNLISNVATLKQREHTWSLLTVSDSGADKVSETLRRAMPKLFRHVGDAKNLLLVGGTADQIKEATEFLELSQFVESNVAHTGHANGVQPAAMVDAEQNVIEVIALRNVLAGEVSGMLNKLLVRTNVVTDAEAQSNSIVVSGSPTQIDSVKTLIAKLDVAAGKPSPVGQPMPPNTVVDPLAHESLVEDSHRLARSGDRDGLRKALQAEFEARQKMQVAQLAALKQKLQLLEQRIRTHETFKQQMIETRLQNLLRDPVMSEAKPKPAAENAKPGGLYKIQAGDTLGFVIENVLGAEGVAPPIHVDPTGVRGPVMGYPIPVRNDGTISLPLIKPVKVAGMTLLQLVNKVRGEYVNSSVLAEGQDYILATLIRSVDDQPARSTSPPTIKTPTASRRTSGKIAPGDTLGLVIEQILGNGDEPAPIHTDPTGARPPVMGYPIQVRADGTITLPYLGKVKVDGLSLGELEEKLETEFVGRDILMEGKTVIMVAMIRESSSPAREFVGTGTGWQTLDASGDEPKGRPSGIRQSFMNNLKSPSDFTDKEAELTIEIAQAEAGPIHELRSRRLEALRKEHKLVLSTIESDLKLAKARLVKAKETEAFQQRMAKRGYSTATETTAARLAVGAAEAELEQLQKLYEAYRGALQGEAGKEGSNAKEKNTSPSGPNATTSPDSTVKLALNFKAAPWAAVLKTLAEANKLNLNVQDSPPGTFSYQSGKQYTPQQALDVVAGHLLQDGYLTVRKDDFLTVWASENGLPPSLVPQASPEDLNTKYAGLDNVLLTVSFKVEGDVEELAREIDVLLDPQPFVRIAALNRSKTIIVTELSQNLRRVAKLLRPNKEETGFSKPSRTSGMFDAFDSFRSYERPGNSDRPKPLTRCKLLASQIYDPTDPVSKRMNDTWGNPQVLHGTLQWKNRTYARAESGFLFCIENEKIIWRQLVSRWYRHLSVQELPDGRQVLVLQSTPGDQVYAGSALKSEARDLATGDRVDVRGSGVIAKAPKLESHWAVIATGAGVAVCENDKQFQNAIKKFAKGMSRGGMWPDFKKSNVLFYSTKIEPSRQLRVLGGSVDDRRNIVRVTRRLDRIENSVRQKKHDFEFCWVTIPKSAKPIVIQEEVSVVDGMPQWKNLHTLIRDDDGSWSEPAFASPRSASDSQSTPNTAMSRAQQPLSAETKDKRKTTLDMYHGGTQKMLETLMTSYRPMQSDAVYAVVRSLDGVNLEVKKSVRGAGGYYAVTGANGHPLRRFSDTNGDMQADRFVYYKDGKKSYEELDTNHDHKIDKFLYYAKDGSITKTLVDKNGDGVADEESAASN